MGYLFISHDRALCERFCTAIRLWRAEDGRTRMKNAPSGLSRTRTSLLVSVMFFADWKANEMRVDSRYYPVLQ